MSQIREEISRLGLDNKNIRIMSNNGEHQEELRRFSSIEILENNLSRLADKFPHSRIVVSLKDCSNSLLTLEIHPITSAA